MTKRSVPWSNEGPGKVFMQNFQRRWHHRIRIHKSESLRTACVKRLTKEVVRDFLSTLKSIYDKYDLYERPERIFNADETCLTTDATSSSCFYKRCESQLDASFCVSETFKNKFFLYFFPKGI